MIPTVFPMGMFFSDSFGIISAGQVSTEPVLQPSHTQGAAWRNSLGEAELAGGEDVEKALKKVLEQWLKARLRQEF